MMPRLTVAEVAEATRKDPQTVRRALQAGELHGVQSKVRGHWTVREDCAEAWADKTPCEHQLATVTQIKTRRTASA